MEATQCLLQYLLVHNFDRTVNGHQWSSLLELKAELCRINIQKIAANILVVLTFKRHVVIIFRCQ